MRYRVPGCFCVGHVGFFGVLSVRSRVSGSRVFGDCGTRVEGWARGGLHMGVCDKKGPPNRVPKK